MSTDRALQVGGGGGDGGPDPTLRAVAQVAHGLSIGMPIHLNGAAWEAADNDDDTKTADALVDSVTSADAFVARLGGPLTATTAQWDARTGDTGGLVASQYYWLSSTTGGLTKTQPTSGIQQSLGVAESATVLLVRIGEVVGAGSSGGSSPTTTEGDLIVRGASADQRLAIGAGNSMVPKVVSSVSGKLQYEYPVDFSYEDSEVEALNYYPPAVPTTLASTVVNARTYAVASGAGFICSLVLGLHDALCWQLDSTTATTTTVVLIDGPNDIAISNLVAGANGSFDYIWWVDIPVLSTSGERMAIYVGLCASASAFTNLIYFGYSDNVNSGKWQCNTTASSSNTPTDSGVTVAAATMYRLRIWVESAGSVKFYIKTVGGTETLVSTHTTNIPSVGLRGIVAYSKQVGTTSRKVRVYKRALHRRYTSVQ